MGKSKIFDIIGKINSVLFLVLLSGIGVFVVFWVIAANNWQDRRAVEVVQDGNEKESIELILGNIASVDGHDAQYVKLHSRARGGKFSSYSGRGEVRNVLFFTGDKLESHWLYSKNQYLIGKFSVLTHEISAELAEEKKGRKKIAKAIYMETITEDTNGNHELDENDLITISLVQPNGKSVTEIETGVQSVVDYDFLDDNESLMLLFQKDNKVIVKKYSLSSFEVKSETVVNEISRKL